MTSGFVIVSATKATVAAWPRGAGVFVAHIATTVRARAGAMYTNEAGPASETADRHRPASAQNAPGQTEPQTTGRQSPRVVPCIANGKVYGKVYC